MELQWETKSNPFLFFNFYFNSYFIWLYEKKCHIFHKYQEQKRPCDKMGLSRHACVNAVFFTSELTDNECLCACFSGCGGLFEVLVASVCGQTDWQTERQGWTDRLQQAKQQVCLLNVTHRHMNALFTFSPADSCFHQQKKRLLLLLVTDCLSSVGETAYHSLYAFMSLYHPCSLMLYFFT